MPGAYGQCREEHGQCQETWGGEPQKPRFSRGGVRVLGQVRPPPDLLLSSPICAPRLTGARCTRAGPAADQLQPDGRGGRVLSCSRGRPEQLRAPEMDWHPSDEKLGSAAAPGPPGWAAGRGAGKQCQAPRVGKRKWVVWRSRSQRRGPWHVRASCPCLRFLFCKSPSGALVACGPGEGDLSHRGS